MPSQTSSTSGAAALPSSADASPVEASSTARPDTSTATDGPPIPSAGTSARTVMTRRAAVDRDWLDADVVGEPPGDRVVDLGPGARDAVGGPRSAVAAYRAPSERGGQGGPDVEHQRDLHQPGHERRQDDDHQHEVDDRGAVLPARGPPRTELRALRSIPSAGRAKRGSR